MYLALRLGPSLLIGSALFFRASLLFSATPRFLLFACESLFELLLELCSLGELLGHHRSLLVELAGGRSCFAARDFKAIALDIEVLIQNMQLIERLILRPRGRRQQPGAPTDVEKLLAFHEIDWRFVTRADICSHCPILQGGPKLIHALLSVCDARRRLLYLRTQCTLMSQCLLVARRRFVCIALRLLQRGSRSAQLVAGVSRCRHRQRAQDEDNPKDE